MKTIMFGEKRLLRASEGQLKSLLLLEYILFVLLCSLDGLCPPTGGQALLNTLRVTAALVMEHSGEDDDEFLRDVTMTGQPARFCCESLSVLHLVTSHYTNNLGVGRGSGGHVDRLEGGRFRRNFENCSFPSR